MSGKVKYKPIASKNKYAELMKINGDHPFKNTWPLGYIEYEARARKNGKVLWFNFDLAKEMGLIPASHTNEINKALSNQLIDTFALTIINEWDLVNKKKFEQKKAGRYMATRYLQMQHPRNDGYTSGDGRSIWNGSVSHKGVRWDITSCGTGATCLSPATAHNNRFYRTGDKTISYGCGFSNLDEGMIDVLFSEVFFHNSIRTERVLCVLEFPGPFAITVRAGPNLIRPSHFFCHLKQSKLDRLRGVADSFIDREISNKTWGPLPRSINKYDYMLKQLCSTFAEVSAQFELEYIFCWLDWDGDNILADGGVVDFGSVRQFGMFHHEYKFDDDAKWSTNIKEQKQKAKLIIQTFAQIVDYLKTGTKKPQGDFKNHPIFDDFERIFVRKKRELLLKKIGLKQDQVDILLNKDMDAVAKFEKIFRQFELRKAVKGPQRVPDGTTWNAVYCLRNILRELPIYLRLYRNIMPDDLFLDVICSRYTDAEARELTYHRRRNIQLFQKSYIQLLESVCKNSQIKMTFLVHQLSNRSAIINRNERITGDGICLLAEYLLKVRKKISPKNFETLVKAFVRDQVLDPDVKNKEGSKRFNKEINTLLSQLNKIMSKCSQGL